MRAKDELIRSGSFRNAELIATSVKDMSLMCPKLCAVYFLRTPAVAILWDLMS